uniref:Thioredoxin reductase-like n=1 Tax=Dermatophagoides pteronyssinus TaxID=6956 RepID=A0A6P6YC23_DERPT|nr:thioredoxin reductase-like [Dermatophagoides pteronyssinus]
MRREQLAIQKKQKTIRFNALQKQRLEAKKQLILKYKAAIDKQNEDETDSERENYVLQKFKDLLIMNEQNNISEYDFVVIGGGSGGLAAAKEASLLNAKVILFDYVTESTQGTKWGLGGLANRLSAYALGWSFESVSFNWLRCRETITNYIKSLNFSYRNGLRNAGVTYVNALASFYDENTIIYQKKDEIFYVRFKYALVAVGGRPFIPKNIKGALKYAITSDDLFWTKTPPGKTLVVGGSYIALECAGFLMELGYDVTISVRSVLLRGFDRQCAEKLGSIMQQLGCTFLMKVLPVKIDKLENEKLMVEFSDGSKEIYDTVLYAAGRRAQLEKLNLKKAHVDVSGGEVNKIRVNSDDSTSNPNIFAIGDCAHGRPELTPTAIKAGETLARRLFNDSNILMNYSLVPTVVFTPIEYGCVGFSEEMACEVIGKENVQVYLSEFKGVLSSATKWPKFEECRSDEYDEEMEPENLSKLVIDKRNGKVLGFHCVAFNAGETTHGYALALSKGVTKQDFDNLICIHPTDAESFHILDVEKSSGVSWVKSGSCGGGKCG